MIKPILTTEWESEVKNLQKTFKSRTFKRRVPESDFPEIEITLPSSLDTIELAPFYDVHIGSHEHDAELFQKHLKWVADTPNVFSWGGGDLFENITDSKMGHTHLSNEEQIYETTRQFSKIQHKMFFSIPGNHEDRTYKQSGTCSAKRLADNLELPFFPDFCFCALKWRGNTFHIMAHHGAGGGSTAGAQRMAGRKGLEWASADIIWSGHLHNPFADIVYRTDYDQKTGRLFERSCLVMMSPSYVKFFGSYAAKKRLTPGTRGLSVATLHPDGRIDVNIHARGKRL